MALQRDETHQLQTPLLVLDGLYCEEELGECVEDGSEKCGEFVKKETFSPLFCVGDDLFWEDDELMSLVSKEKENHFCYTNVVLDECLVLAREEAVEWVLKVKAHFGFNALTAVLAVNYLDRFISSLGFQRDKPWMGQLVAAVCLSLAAKVEETHVPLLLDLQVLESKYVFEARTVQRMELLVLSSLGWRMHPVTPISFFHHIIRRLGLRTNLHWEFLRRCERLLLSLIADASFLGYLPSILAAATMLHVIEEVEPWNHLEYQNQLMGVLKICEAEVKECYKLIQELSGSNCKENHGNKRKHSWIPCSPSGVVDASFSSDIWNDSWGVTVTQSVSSSPEPRLKRSRAPDQQMQLPPLNRMFVDVLSTPH
ncbi:hypothetical protein SLE2022_301470 [Rubroshorea leprosula]